MERIKIDGKSAAAGALCGLALGLGAGYLVGQLVSRRKAEELINRETNAVRQHYRDRTGRELAGDESDAGQRPEATVGTAGMGNMSINVSSDPRLIQPGTGIISVSGDGAGGEARGSDPASPEDSGPIVLDDRVPGAMIYVITLDEFAGEMEDYDKSELRWYAKDNTLTDDKDVPIRDVENTIGTMFMHHFGWQSGSEALVYVRNNYLEHDFEIILDKGSWIQRHHNYGNPQ